MVLKRIMHIRFVTYEFLVIGFRMDSLVFLLLAIVSYLSVLVSAEGWFHVDPSILGLSLSLLIQLAGLFQWCIRQSAGESCTFCLILC
jgi:hypothetical protein